MLPAPNIFKFSSGKLVTIVQFSPEAWLNTIIIINTILLVSLAQIIPCLIFFQKL